MTDRNCPSDEESRVRHAELKTREPIKRITEFGLGVLTDRPPYYYIVTKGLEGVTIFVEKVLGRFYRLINRPILQPVSPIQ